MNCFPCFQSWRNRASDSRNGNEPTNVSGPPETKRHRAVAAATNDKKTKMKINARAFTFRELATATKNFRQECLLGEGGFGRVYKGILQPSNEVVAVKQLDKRGLNGNKDFLVEVSSLSFLSHPNLVKLIGYCADGDQRLLVFEYMSGGSLQDHLFVADLKPGQKPLDWATRIKIAYGVALGLEYLHDQANPPVIYRDLKGSNILLDENMNPKLSDLDMEMLGLTRREKIPPSSRVMGMYGYCAPEYARGGYLTVKSDVYSFGVVLLEVITGRRAVDTTRPVEEQNLVAWAQPIFKDPKRFPDMADPLLNKIFSETILNQAVAIAAMCLQEEAIARPLISDVVTALGFLSMSSEVKIPTAVPILSQKLASISSGGYNQDSGPKRAQSSNEESSTSNSSVQEDARHEAQMLDSDKETELEKEHMLKSGESQTEINELQQDWEYPTNMNEFQQVKVFNISRSRETCTSTSPGSQDVASPNSKGGRASSEEENEILCQKADEEGSWSYKSSPSSFISISHDETTMTDDERAALNLNSNIELHDGSVSSRSDSSRKSSNVIRIC